MANLSSKDIKTSSTLSEDIMKERQSSNSYGNPDDSLDIGDVFLAMREDRELYEQEN